MHVLNHPFLVSAPSLPTLLAIIERLYHPCIRTRLGKHKIILESPVVSSSLHFSHLAVLNCSVLDITGISLRILDWVVEPGGGGVWVRVVVLSLVLFVYRYQLSIYSVESSVHSEILNSSNRASPV